VSHSSKDWQPPAASNSNPSDPQEYVRATAEESARIREQFLKDHLADLVEGSRTLAESIRKGGKILIFGNGGSAADAQHMAAEMVGRMLVDRRPLPAIALTTDSSNLTAIGNDFGYEQVFAKQVEALARPGDVVIAISTSGTSANVLKAVEVAQRIGCRVISLTGGTGGKLHAVADIGLNAVLGKNSSRIQETHSFAIHTLVDLLDRYFLEA
jgi:D-sedoheptulose 7-phosphate isomerase